MDSGIKTGLGKGYQKNSRDSRSWRRRHQDIADQHKFTRSFSRDPLGSRPNESRRWSAAVRAVEAGVASIQISTECRLHHHFCSFGTFHFNRSIRAKPAFIPAASEGNSDKNVVSKRSGKIAAPPGPSPKVITQRWIFYYVLFQSFGEGFHKSKLIAGNAVAHLRSPHPQNQVTFESNATAEILSAKM